MNSSSKLKNLFDLQGYFKIENFFKITFVQDIKNEIELLKSKQSKEIQIYTDKNGHIRRIERFYQSSKKIMEMNEIILKELHNVFEEKFEIFKDKCNFKPPNSEGFFAHYDGIFKWKDSSGNIRKGWDEYSTEFITVLLTLDDFTLENGALEISKWHNENFEKLFERTKKHGTLHENPFSAGKQVYQETVLSDDQLKKCEFKPMIVKAGSLIFFSHKCPHRSAKNKSKGSRGSLYLTYNPARFGNHYDSYFNDKKESQNLVN